MAGDGGDGQLVSRVSAVLGTQLGGPKVAPSIGRGMKRCRLGRREVLGTGLLAIV